MSDLSIDKLNVIKTKKTKRSKDRAIPYEEYFGGMNIDYMQFADRVMAAEEFEPIFMRYISHIKVLNESGYKDYTRATRQFVEEYAVVVEKWIDDKGFLSWYPLLLAALILDATIRNANDEWFYSLDRAMFNAENEANTVLNRSDYQRAIAAGKTKKTWLTQLDNRVRKTHEVLEGVTMPIRDLFQVGASMMRFPHDYEMCDDGNELLNCRCSVSYS